jgi:trk system potassium uptake protein TrkA
MKIVIAGAGRGGLSLAVHLQKRGHIVIIVDKDPVVVQHASEAHGIVTLLGDATDTMVLAQAEPGRADAVLAMLHRDSDNLAVALLARSLGAKRTLVRMRDPNYRAVYEGVGIVQILSETEVLVGGLATAVEFQAVRHSMVLGSGEAIAVEITIPESSWVVGQSVSKVAQSKSFPRSCVVAGMSNEGAIKAPRGASVFEAGMDVLLVSAQKDLASVIDFFLRSSFDEAR